MSINPDFIYIAGYGRSGSTLLERLLQCQHQVHACGEMTGFFRMYGSGSSRCSCGRTLEECEFWGGVARHLFQQNFYLHEFSSYHLIQKKREGHWSHGGSFLPDKYHAEYSRLMRPFFEALTRQNSENRIFIDSSKTAYLNPLRPVAVSQLGKFRVRVIHLVRDPRGVIWSVKRGLNRSLETGKKARVKLPTVRAVAGWVFANRAASKLELFFGKDNYCLVRYEDLVDNPVYVLERIARRWNIDLQESIGVAKKAVNGSQVQLTTMHQLSGNRMRFSKTFSISPDYAWKEKINPNMSAIVKNATMPLLKKYGYV